MTALLAALLAGAAAWFVLPWRPGLAGGKSGSLTPAAPAGVEPAPLITRGRPVLAVLAGVGGYLFFGGFVGLGVAALAAATAWRILGRVEPAAVVRRRIDVARDLPPAVDLLASAFGSGASPPQALRLVAEALGGPVGDDLTRVRRRLDLGADPARVWTELTADPQLAPLARALGRAHASGTSVVAAAERLAEELRELGRSEVETRARAVSTRAAAPLGACFLPAFVLLGIVPLVAGLLRALHLTW